MYNLIPVLVLEQTEYAQFSLGDNVLAGSLRWAVNIIKGVQK